LSSVTGKQDPVERVREAYKRLMPHDRRVLPLRELRGSSYAEIAGSLGIAEVLVPDLLWRARLALRDELYGSALTPLSPMSPRCRRALPLIARREDGELHDERDRDWLEGHLRNCGKCRLYTEAMREASAAYRQAVLNPQRGPTGG
jgi:hypothetical protein